MDIYKNIIFAVLLGFIIGVSGMEKPWITEYLNAKAESKKLDEELEIQKKEIQDLELEKQRLDSWRKFHEEGIDSVIEPIRIDVKNGEHRILQAMRLEDEKQTRSYKQHKLDMYAQLSEKYKDISMEFLEDVDCLLISCQSNKY